MMGGPGHMSMMAPGWQGMIGAAMMGDYGPMTEGRLAYMKAELGNHGRAKGGLGRLRKCGQVAGAYDAGDAHVDGPSHEG